MQVRHLTKQEYIQAKNIPSCLPIQKLSLDPPAMYYQSPPFQQIPQEPNSQSSTHFAMNRPMVNSASQPQMCNFGGQDAERLRKRNQQLEEETKNLKAKVQTLTGSLSKEKQEKNEVEKKIEDLEQNILLQDEEKKQFLETVNNVNMEIENIENYKRTIRHLQEDNQKLQDENMNQDNMFNMKIQEFNKQVQSQQIEFQTQQNSPQAQETIRSQDEALKNQEQKIILLSQEIQRLQLHNENLNEWRIKHDQLKVDHQVEIEHLRCKDEQQNKSFVKYEESFQKTEQEKQIITEKNLHLEQQCQYYCTEIKNLHYANSNLEEKLRNNIDNEQMKKDNTFLNMTIQEKNREIEYLQEKLKIIEKSSMESIEELKSHYEAMRKSVIMREIQELNIKFNSEKSSMESTIKNISQRNYELEQQMQLLEQENDKLQGHYDSKHMENEQLKSIKISAETEAMKFRSECDSHINNYIQLEQKHKIQLDDVQSKHQRNKEIELEKQHSEIKENYEKDQKSLLEQQALLQSEIERRSSQYEESTETQKNSIVKIQELERHNGQLSSLHDQELKQKNSLKDELETYIRQFTLVQDSKKDSENKCAMFAIENERLLQVQIQKDANIQEANKNFEFYKNSTTIEIQQIRKQYEDIQKLKAQEIENLSNQQEQYASQLQELILEKQGFEQQMLQMNDKIISDTNHAQYLNYEIDKLKNQNTDLENEREQTNQIFEQYKNEIQENMQEQQTIYNSERQQLEIKITQLMHDLDDNQHEINNLTSENLNLKQISEQRIKEFEQQQHQSFQQNVNEDDHELLQSQYEQKSKQCQELEENQIRQNKEKKQLQNQYQHEQQQLLIQKEDNEMINNLLEQRKQDMDKKDFEIENHKKKVEQLKEKNQQLESSKLQDKLKIDEHTRENEELKGSTVHYKKQIEKMRSDFSQQEQQIQGSVQDLLRVKKTYESHYPDGQRQFSQHQRSTSPMVQNFSAQCSSEKQKQQFQFPTSSQQYDISPKQAYNNSSSNKEINVNRNQLVSPSQMNFQGSQRSNQNTVSEYGSSGKKNNDLSNFDVFSPNIEGGRGREQERFSTRYTDEKNNSMTKDNIQTQS